MKLTWLEFILKRGQKGSGLGREDYGKAASLVGLTINLALSALKMSIGFISGSVALLGDGINNLTDSLSSVISLVSFSIAAKPADREHPYGHARIEYLFSTLVASLVFYAGITLFIESVRRIIDQRIPERGLWLALSLVISIILKFWLNRFYRAVAHKINSELLLATAADSMSDVVASAVILISLFLPWSIDGYMGLLVSVLILKAGLEILKSTADQIMGAAPSENLLVEITDFLLSYEGVRGVHDVQVHDYGAGRILVVAHTEVDGSATVRDCHELIDQIEIEAEEKMGLHLTIHMDPDGVKEKSKQSITCRL